MTEIIGVRFKSGGKQYYFDPCGHQISLGQGVVIETSRGIEYGECIKANSWVADESIIQPLRPLIRPATEQDTRTVHSNREKEKKAFRICQEKIQQHRLDMKLVEVEYSFEGNKILFFFTAENRVDFRTLVKDLAAIFHTRIELRQIGVRDEAKMLGGLGICGRPFCCSQFLDDFQPVSIKMAKTQNLSLNPAKISGTCGRLMCCLKYEQDAYEDAIRRCPKQESFVETPDGVGNVTQVNLLREQVKVRLEDSQEPPKVYRNIELKVIRNGKGKRPDGYVAPSVKELESRRYVEPVEDITPVLNQKSSLSAALEAVFSGNTPPVMEKHQPEERSGNRNSGRNRRRKPSPNANEGSSGKLPTKQAPTGERRPSQKATEVIAEKVEKKNPRTKREQGQKPTGNQSTIPAPKADTQAKTGESGNSATEAKKAYRPRRRRWGGNGNPKTPGQSKGS